MKKTIFILLAIYGSILTTSAQDKLVLKLNASKEYVKEHTPFKVLTEKDNYIAFNMKDKYCVYMFKENKMISVSVVIPDNSDFATDTEVGISQYIKYNFRTLYGEGKNDIYLETLDGKTFVKLEIKENKYIFNYYPKDYTPEEYTWKEFVKKAKGTN